MGVRGGSLFQLPPGQARWRKSLECSILLIELCYFPAAWNFGEIEHFASGTADYLELVGPAAHELRRIRVANGACPVTQGFEIPLRDSACVHRVWESRKRLSGVASRSIARNPLRLLQ